MTVSVTVSVSMRANFVQSRDKGDFMNVSHGYLLFFGGLMLFFYFRLAAYKRERSAKYVLQDFIPKWVPRRSYLAFFVRATLFVAAWLLLSVAYTKLIDKARPNVEVALGAEAASQYPKVDSVVFVLDVSASMGAQDTSDGASRLQKAKDVIKAIVENLGGINCSLLCFAGDCQTIVPDTLDYLYFRILLNSEGVNDVQVAGTNLLAMCDAIKARYVGGPFHKSVRVILLTDGEDTGFLDMDDAAKAKAESALLEDLASTVSESLQWEVVGLGSTNGAEVPGITYEGAKVVSKMQRSLLEGMARVGKGHFYAELDHPITEIADNIIADVAGTAVQDKEQATSSLAPRVTGEPLVFIILAALFIFAGIALPQQERKVRA